MRQEKLDIRQKGSHPERSRRVNGFWLIAFFFLIITSCTQAQNDSNMINEDIEYPEGLEIHSKAKELMNEDFYWSPIEESGPFGSDAGSDAFSTFVEWRTTNKQMSVVVFINALLDEWEYPKLDFNTLDSSELSKEIEEGSGRFRLEIDNVIIASGFGQFVIEGKIDEDIKQLTENALQRQLSDVSLKNWDDEYRKLRELQLRKMMKVLIKMNK